MDCYEYFNDDNLRYNYNIEPLCAEGIYNKNEIIQWSCYSYLSNRYGIIYTPQGDVDSFFKLEVNIDNDKNNKPDVQRLGIKDILKQERFTPDKIDQSQYDKIVLTYQTLIEMPLRYVIERKFSIQLKDYTIREQLQFVNFLSTKTVAEVEEIIQFLDQAQNLQFRKNRIKAFLSLESDQKMGDVILSIGEQLKDQPETADQLFAQYAQMVDAAEQTAEEVMKISEEVFFEKKLDKNKIIQNILRGAAGLLRQAHEKIQGKTNNDKRKIIKDLISDLKRKTRIQKQSLADLVNMNKTFYDVKKMIIDELDTGDYYTLFAELYGDPEQYKTPQELDEAIKQGKIKPWWIDIDNIEQQKEEIFKKMDSKVIGLFIKTVKRKIKEEVGHYKESGFYNLEDEEHIRQFGASDPIDLSALHNHKRRVNDVEEKIKKAKSILSLQRNIEKKIEELIYGYKTPELPENIEPNIADRIFQKYGEIVEMAQRIRKEAPSLLKTNKEVSEEDLDKISEQLLNKAKCLLDNFIVKIKQGEKINEEEFLQELDDYRADLLLTLSVYKGLKGKIDVEDLHNISFERVSADKYAQYRDIILQLGEGRYKKRKNEDEVIKELREMFELYKKNYKDRPKLQKILLKSFAQSLVNNPENIHLFIVKSQGRVVGFNRFEKQSKDKKYFGSCNVMPAAQRLSVGGALFRYAVQKESPGNEVLATCDAFTPISSLYIEEGNFVVEKIDTKSDPIFLGL